MLGLPGDDGRDLDIAAARDAVGQRVRGIQRRRRLVTAGAGVLAAVVLAAGLAMADEDDPPAEVRVAAPETTTTEATTTTAPAETTTTGLSPTTTTSPPAATPMCVEETAEAGNNHYTGEPNQPLLVRACVSSTMVAVGQRLQLQVHAEDPDAPVPDRLYEPKDTPCGPALVTWGDIGFGVGCGMAGCPETAETIAPQPGSGDYSADHGYTEAGTYEVGVTVLSGVSPQCDGWGNQVSITIPVTVVG